MLNSKGKAVGEQSRHRRMDFSQSLDLKHRLQSTSKWTRLLPAVSLKTVACEGHGASPAIGSEIRTTRSKAWPPPWLGAKFLLGRRVGHVKQRLLIHLPEVSGLIDVAARLLHHSRFLLLTIHVPVAGLDRTGDRNVGRAQGLMGFGAVGMIGNQWDGALVDRRPLGAMVLFLVILAVGMMAAAPFAGNYMLLIGALILWGVAYTALFPVCQVRVMNAGAKAQALAATMNISAANAGIGLGAISVVWALSSSAWKHWARSQQRSLRWQSSSQCS